jgi:hypothetical protein
MRPLAVLLSCLHSLPRHPLCKPAQRCGMKATMKIGQTNFLRPLFIGHGFLEFRNSNNVIGITSAIVLTMATCCVTYPVSL